MDPSPMKILLILLFLLMLYVLWRSAFPSPRPSGRADVRPEGFDAPPHNYPDCAAYRSDQTPNDSCTPYGVTRVNERYRLPDGRCVKAKAPCSGCLEAMINDPAWVDTEAFDSCEAERDTRVIAVPQGQTLPDCDAYIKRYGPILAPNGGDCRAATYHWTGWMRGSMRIRPRSRTQGRHEGLRTDPFVFDCISYLGRYPNVLNWTGPDCTKALQHYTEVEKEGTSAALDLNLQVFPLCAEVPGRCVMPGNVLREATYRISQGRCVRPANANIPVARLVDLNLRGESSPHFSDGSFLSCTPGSNSFADPPKVDFPGCRDRGEGCLQPGGYAKNGQRYVLPNGRCLRSVGVCLGCLEEEQGRDTLMDKNTVAFESCEYGRDTTSVYTVGPAFYYPACRTEGPPCLDAAGRQIKHARYYTMYKGQPRCLRAVTDCGGCLNAVEQHDVLPDQFRGAFASCDPNVDTTDRSGQPRYPGRHCVVQGGCLTSDGRQKTNYKYQVGGRCLRALTDCKGCLDIEQANTDKRIKPEHHLVFGSCSEDVNTTRYNYRTATDQYPNEA